MNSNIYNSIILSNEQVDYLMHGTAGINRLSCLFQLIQIVTRQIEANNMVEETTTTLWELNMSEVAISKLWKCDRKTVSKMLDNMNRLDILSSIQTRRGSVHTLLCISAWIVDGKKYVNPHYVPINMRGVSGNATVTNSTTMIPHEGMATTNDNNNATYKAEIPNKEDPPICKAGASSRMTDKLSFSSHGIGTIQDTEVYEPSASDMALEEEARQHFFKEQTETEDASQDILLG